MQNQDTTLSPEQRVARLETLLGFFVLEVSRATSLTEVSIAAGTMLNEMFGRDLVEDPRLVTA